MIRYTKCLHALTDLQCNNLLIKHCNALRGTRKLSATEACSLIARWIKAGDQPGEKTARTAIGYAVNARDDTSLSFLWKELIRGTGIKLQGRDYQLMATTFSQCGNIEALRKLWSDMKAFNHPPTLGILHSVAECLISKKETSLAMEGLLRSTCFPLNSSTMSLLLIATEDSTIADRLIELYDIKVTKSLLTFNALLSVYSKEGNTEAAEKLWRKRPPQGDDSKPVDVQRSWTLLLECYKEKGDWEGIELAWIRQGLSDTERNVIDATVLIGCASVCKNPTSVLPIVSDVFEAFTRSGYPPLFTEMMKLFSVTSQGEQAFSLYRWVRRNGIETTPEFIKYSDIATGDREYANFISGTGAAGRSF